MSDWQCTKCGTRITEWRLTQELSEEGAPDGELWIVCRNDECAQDIRFEVDCVPVFRAREGASDE